MQQRGRPKKTRRPGPAVRDALRELAQEAADAWNAAHPPRTLVRPLGSRKAPRPTLTFAQVLGGRDAVVWISGVAGCVRIDELEVVSKGGSDD